MTRARRDGDVQYLVRIRTQAGDARIAVGKFWASDREDAIAEAMRTYPTLFNVATGNGMVPDAEPV